MKKRIIWLLLTCFILNWYIKTNLITKTGNLETECIKSSKIDKNNQTSTKFFTKNRILPPIDLSQIKTIRARKYMNLRKNNK